MSVWPTGISRPSSWSDQTLLQICDSVAVAAVVVVVVVVAAAVAELDVKFL